MVFLEDPITGDQPSRFQTEEDEELAQQLTQQYRATPTVEVKEGSPEYKTVVFLIGPAAAVLASTFFSQAQEVGSISVPELQRLRSPYEEEYGSPRTHTHTSSILHLAEGLAVVTCDKVLPPEQAVAWAGAVLDSMRPEQLVVATTIPAMEYRGPGSPSDDDLVFSLHTSPATAGTAAPAAAPAGSGSGSGGKAPPPLPPGTLLGGLPAALLSLCARRKLAGAAVVGVQLGPAPDAAFVRSLAEGVQGELRVLGVDLGPHVQAGPQLLAAIREVTDRIYRSSAGNSIFA